MLDLIVKELAEVADIHTALTCVNNGDLCAYLRALDTCDRLCDVAQLANAGRLDKYAVGLILAHDLLKRFGEVTDKGAADAAGVHLGYLDARVLEEAAVNGDLAEFVFDENELFIFVALGNELADERGLACAQKSGKNVYLSQGNYLPNKIHY